MRDEDIAEIEALLAALIAPSPGAFTRARVAKILNENAPLQEPEKAPTSGQVEEHIRIRNERSRIDRLGRPILDVPPPPVLSPPILPVGIRAWVVDCETTGLANYDRIVSFAAVETVNGRATGKYLYLVFNPERPSHPRAAEVHGWSDTVLKRQKLFRESAEGIREILTSADEIVGHNLDFDMTFLRREILESGLRDIDPNLYCTMWSYREQYPNRKAKLDLCLREIGVKRSGKTHSALEDAFLTAVLYSWLKFNDGQYIAPVEWPRPSNYQE